MPVIVYRASPFADPPVFSPPVPLYEQYAPIPLTARKIKPARIVAIQRFTMVEHHAGSAIVWRSGSSYHVKPGWT
jgi:hypothetical protein